MAFSGQGLTGASITRCYLLRLRALLAGTLGRLGVVPARVIVLGILDVPSGDTPGRGVRALAAASEVQLTFQADMADMNQAVTASQRLVGDAAAQLARTSTAYLAPAGVQGGILTAATVQAPPSQQPSQAPPSQAPPEPSPTFLQASLAVVGTSESSLFSDLSFAMTAGIAAAAALLTALVVALLLRRRTVYVNRRALDADAPEQPRHQLHHLSSVESQRDLYGGRGARRALQPTRARSRGSLGSFARSAALPLGAKVVQRSFREEKGGPQA